MLSVFVVALLLLRSGAFHFLGTLSLHPLEQRLPYLFPFTAVSEVSTNPLFFFFFGNEALSQQF